MVLGHKSASRTCDLCSAARGRDGRYAAKWAERAADKIVFSTAELTGNIWMMENISE